MANVEITTDRNRDLTVFTVKGNFSASEALDTLHRFYNNGPTRDIIWDLCAANVATMDADSLTSIIAYAKSQAPHRRRGRSALVGDKDTTFGIVRMYETLSEAHEHPIIHATFRSLEEAHNWLAHTPATITTS